MEIRKGMSGRIDELDQLVAKYGDITILECIEKVTAEECLRRR